MHKMVAQFCSYIIVYGPCRTVLFLYSALRVHVMCKRFVNTLLHNVTCSLHTITALPATPAAIAFLPPLLGAFSIPLSSLLNALIFLSV